MKILHCADLHLDSAMTAHLSKEQATRRKAELLHTFVGMVEYARENGVEMILIAGDLFDEKQVASIAVNTVCQLIRENPNILFFYLPGNHDGDGLFLEMEEKPSNLQLFGPKWRRYAIECEGKRLAITGLELSAETQSNWKEALSLDKNDFNIVMLHGQIMEYGLGEKKNDIPISCMRNRGIDYLALGHVHSYEKRQMDARGIYCYPGCLEGHGFDECGEHGFVLLDIDMKQSKWKTTFVPFAFRRFWRVAVDVSKCIGTREILTLITEKLKEAECAQRDFVEICLIGDWGLEQEKNMEYLRNWLAEDFYYIQLKDQTTIRISYDTYEREVSLKGEFVRCVREQMDLSEEEKTQILQLGMKALAGED